MDGSTTQTRGPVSRLAIRMVAFATSMLIGATSPSMRASGADYQTEGNAISPRAIAGPRSELTTVLSLLPDDTDSVLISRGTIPARLSAFIRPEHGQPAMPPLEQLCSATNAEVLAGADCVMNSDTFRKSIENVPVRFTIGAGRRYHCAATPSYERCCFIVFAAAAPAGLRAELARAARQTHSVQNTSVFEFDYANEEDNASRMDVYAAFPAMDTLLLATDLDFLKVILTRVAQPKDNRTTPSLLRGFEAKYDVDTVWGIHRFSQVSIRGAGRQFLPKIQDAKVTLVTISYSSKDRRLTITAAPNNADSAQWLEQLMRGLVGPTFPLHARRSGSEHVELSFTIAESGNSRQADSSTLPNGWTPSIALYIQGLLALGVPWVSSPLL